LLTKNCEMAPLGRLLHSLWIGRQLAGVFAYRRRRLSELFPGAR
jgi:hypothetical protein